MLDLVGDRERERGGGADAEVAGGAVPVPAAVGRRQSQMLRLRAQEASRNIPSFRQSRESR
jgi:hypothetical protein